MSETQTKHPDRVAVYGYLAADGVTWVWCVARNDADAERREAVEYVRAKEYDRLVGEVARLKRATHKHAKADPETGLLWCDICRGGEGELFDQTCEARVAALAARPEAPA